MLTVLIEKLGGRGGGIIGLLDGVTELRGGIDELSGRGGGAFIAVVVAVGVVIAGSSSTRLKFMGADGGRGVLLVALPRSGLDAT